METRESPQHKKVKYMTERRIENLPDRVYRGIFKWLDVSSQKNFALTSTKLKQKADEACSWCLRLKYQNEGFATSLEGMTKIFSKICIENLSQYDNQWKTGVLARHGSNATELEVNFDNDENSMNFFELLALTPNIRKLTILNCTKLTPLDDQIDLPELKDLTAVELIESNFVLIKYLRKYHFSSLKISMTKNCHVSWSEKNWMNHFISTRRCLRLVEVNVDLSGSSSQFCKALSELELPVKRFSISSRDFNVSKEKEKVSDMLSFLAKSKNMIEDIQFDDQLPSTFYGLILPFMKNLKTMRVMLSGEGENDEWRLFDNDHFLRNVRILKIYETQRPKNYSYIGKLFASLPNIIELSVASKDKIDSWCDSLRLPTFRFFNLVKLSVDVFHHETIDKSKFPCLKFLSIKRLTKSLDWNIFTELNDGIKGIFIENVQDKSYIRNRELKAIDRNLSLNFLTLGGNISCDADFFEIIRTQFRSLEVLTIERRCLGVDISNVADIHKLVIVSDLSKLQRN